MDRELPQGAARNGALELLGSLAILRSWHLWSSTIGLSDEDREHCEGGTQRISRKPKFPPRILATTRMGPQSREASPGAGAKPSRGPLKRVKRRLHCQPERDG